MNLKDMALLIFKPVLVKYDCNNFSTFNKYTNRFLRQCLKYIILHAFYDNLFFPVRKLSYP